MIKLIKKLFFKPKGYFTIYKDSKSEWRFNLKSPNNKIIATSESYKLKQSCLDGIKSIKKYTRKSNIKEK